MRVLLLGATGLLGNNVLQQLLEAGHEVTALVRRKGGIVAEAAKGSNRLNIIEGDVLRWEDLQTAAEGAEAVVNCAGQTDMSLLRLEEYEPVNVGLCRSLVRLAEERKVATVVHVSTINTVGNGTKERPGDESAAMGEPMCRSLYALSKAEGERIILQAAERVTTKMVVVNPGFILGEYDVKPGSGQLLMAGYGKRVMVAPRGGKAFVWAGDVAAAVVAAIERGRSGKRYIACGDSLTFKELYELQAAVCGYSQRVVEMADWVAKVAGWLGDRLRAIGVRTEVSGNNVAMLLTEEHYDNSLMINELGVKPTAIAEAIERFHRWRNNQNRNHA